MPSMLHLNKQENLSDRQKKDNKVNEKMARNSNYTKIDSSRLQHFSQQLRGTRPKKAKSYDDQIHPFI